MLDISTHALTEGDMISFVTLFVLGYFNSRPHGGRLLSVFSLPGQEFHFNSRPHGGRPASSSTVSAVSEFQLTPSRRATLCCHPRRFSHVYFNSRPHGGRQQPSMVSLLLFHFNSRPHGGRHINNLEWTKSILFQLTPSRRATSFLSSMLFNLLYFNSRPHGGRRQI